MGSGSVARILVAVAAMGLWHCADRMAGGTTEVGNSGLAGTVTTPDGSAARGARLSMYPVAFDPGSGDSLPAAWTAVADSAGGYAIENAVPGSYNLVVRDTARGTSALVRDIRLSGGPGKTDARLAPSGTLAVALDGESARGYFYLPGTDVHRTVDSEAVAAGRLLLEKVPAGIFPELIHVLPGSMSRNILGRPIELKPGLNLELGPYPEWSAVRTLTVSPAADGVALSTDILGFPLLVRLTAANFDFAKAKPKGEDLRITKADGRTPLPFEVESWDVSMKQAAVWVAVDTLHAGGAPQTFLLYTGYASAPAAGRPSAVFDTAAGFVGAWHLGMGLRDATGFGNHGADSGSAPATGLMGMARHFDGDAQFIDVKDHGSLAFGTGDFSMAAWINIEALGKTRQIFSKRSDTANYEVQVTSEGTLQAHVHDKTGGNVLLRSAKALGTNAWNHFAYVRSGGKVSLYVNGVLEDGPADCPYVATSGSLLRIGDDSFLAPGAEGFQGLLDQLEISRKARGADWIRLLHATQKPGASVVRISPAN